ncbi:hypothetical protein GCWU000325_01146 [Alloprevotella tannerae ATCC 51259]|uniref:Uncharacterized protein n=1 Tax=Alloprevotella tannerae ATCC 51259 TaxID=626522 RepID=C9LG06_9BACT|nr:hypothetical protein GCWU000325_01146 [Alloprevotella tannerae ATCC 51259]
MHNTIDPIVERSISSNNNEWSDSRCRSSLQLNVLQILSLRCRHNQTVRLST